MRHTLKRNSCHIGCCLESCIRASPIIRLWNEGDYGAPKAKILTLIALQNTPYNVGYDLNHESPATRYFSKRVLCSIGWKNTKLMAFALI